MDRVKRSVFYPEDISDINNEVVIAVLDSAMSRHPDLIQRIVGFKDFVNGRSTIYDDNGHGTHVCGILSGTGEISGGKYAGIAPNGRILMGKVLDEKGDGKCETMLQALDWVLAVSKEYQVRILNISVGIGMMTDKEKECALQERVERLWDSGILVVCAAGNKGPKNGSISSVGGSNKVITVGCVDIDGNDISDGPCNRFSGRGILGSKLRKPDLVAPGAKVVSCNHRFYRANGEIRNAYIMKNGTSMATPVVSGALAVLLGKNPKLTNEKCKELLLMTAKDMKLPWNQQGWGMVHMTNLLNSTDFF